MKKISTLELSAIILIIIISLNSGINITILKDAVGINSWISLILAYIIGIIPLLLILYISNYKPNLSIQDKIKNLFGKYLGNFINYIITIIILILGITVLYNVNSFTTSQFLARTPIIISTILLVSLSIYHVSKGFNVISKVSQILMCINIALFIISAFTLFKETNLENFLPILKENTNNIIPSTLKIACINILPLIIILIIPKENITIKEKYNKTVIISYIIGTIISFLIIIGTYGVLGIHLVEAFEFPEYMVLKKVTLFGFLERIENIVSIQWIIGSYVYLTLIVYYISNTFNKNCSNNNNKFKITNIIIGIILIISTKYLFKNTTFFNNYIINIFPYLILPILIILIILTIKIFINNRKNDII